MNYIILSNFFVLLILTYLGSAFLSFRYTEINKRILVFVTSFCLMTLINYDGATSLKAVFILIVMLFNLIGIYKAPLSKLLFVLLPFYIIFTVSEVLTSSIFNMLLGLDEYTKPTTIEYFFALCVSNTLAFIITTFYIKFRKTSKGSNLPRYTWLIFILPITTIIYMVTIENYYEIYRSNSILVFILIGLFISNLVTIYIFFKVTESISLKKEMELTQIKEQMAKQQLDSLNQYCKNSFDFLHSFLNQCNNLNELANKGQLEELKNEINKLTEFIYEEFNSLYSNSAILNTVLDSKKESIIKYHIRISTTMEYTDFSFIPLNEQIKLFSYLLDLGISYTKINPENNRMIIIKSFKQNNQLIINEKFNCKNIGDESKFEVEEELNRLLMKYHAFISTKYLKKNEFMSIIILFNQ